MSATLYATLSAVLAVLASVILAVMVVWVLWRSARPRRHQEQPEAPQRIGVEDVWQARARAYLLGPGSQVNTITLAQLTEEIGLSPEAAGTAEITGLVNTLYALDWQPFSVPCADTQGWAWIWRRPLAGATTGPGDHP